MNSTLEYLIHTIGFNGPIILFFSTIINIRNHHIFVFFYLIFSIISVIINKLLKILIKEKRPYGNEIYKDTSDMKIEKYGMPSGHSQNVFFSVMISWLVTHSTKYLLFDLIISLITVYQRWHEKKHTIKQLFVGSIVGIVLAFVTYYSADYYKYYITTQSFSIPLSSVEIVREAELG